MEVIQELYYRSWLLQPDFVWLKSRTQGGTGYNGHALFV